MQRKQDGYSDAMTAETRPSGIFRLIRISAIAASAAAALALLVWAVLLMMDPLTLPIRAIKVSGGFEKVDVHAVEEAVQERAAGNFFTVDMQHIQQAVLAMPWVKNADVRRVWPDQIHVIITEQKPLARWGEQELLNLEGERFMPPRASYPDGLPLLYGPYLSEKNVTAVYYELEEIVAPLGVKISILILDERRSWGIELSNGMRVAAGRGNIAGQVRRFVRFYDKVLAERAQEVATVDLRYSNGYAVSWKLAPVNEQGAQPKGAR